MIEQFSLRVWRRIRRLPGQYGALPLLLRLGLLVFAAGAALDFVFHASPAAWSGTLTLFLGHEGYYAHIVTLLGMVLILLGVLSQKSRLAARAGEPAAQNRR